MKELKELKPILAEIREMNVKARNKAMDVVYSFLAEKGTNEIILDDEDFQWLFGVGITATDMLGTDFVFVRGFGTDEFENIYLLTTYDCEGETTKIDIMNVNSGEFAFAINEIVSFLNRKEEEI